LLEAYIQAKVHFKNPNQGTIDSLMKKIESNAAVLKDVLQPDID
jgi:hypothetical protein